MDNLPTKEELEKLDKYKIAGYAVRNAMRAFAFWSGGEESTNAVKKAIKMSAEFTNEGIFDHIAAPATTKAALAAADSSCGAAASAARSAACAVEAANIFLAYASYAAVNGVNAAKNAANAVVSVAGAEFEKLKILPDGPLDCSSCGPLGPVWPDWKPDDWDESNLDFLYEDPGVEKVD